MAVTYAANPSLAQPDGITYATSVPLTATEADLYNGVAGDPISVVYGQAIVAVVTLTPSGGPTSLNCYIAMQTDMGDGVWVDVAWCVYTNTQASATFVLAGGVAGANSVQQSRQANAFPTPQANGSNQIPIGGRVRFVGKSILVAGSSVAAGQVANISATIKYKLLGLK